LEAIEARGYITAAMMCLLAMC